MNPSVSVVLMAHPSRAHMVPSVVEALDREPVIVWDDPSRRNDPWPNGRQALLAFDPAATHCAILQDDAILCRDLVSGLERALEHVPAGTPVGLYVGRARPRHDYVAGRVALQPDASWLIMRGPWWGVGLVLPTGDIPRLVESADRETVKSYDKRVARWYARERRDCWYTWPSLVDHRPDHESLMHAHTDHNRVAFRFLGADKSALDVDWSKLPAPAPADPYTATVVRDMPMYVCRACGRGFRNEETALGHAGKHLVAMSHPVLERTVSVAPRQAGIMAQSGWVRA